MPNDFETRALQKLLGLNMEDVGAMAPGFMSAIQMAPGVSGPDEQLEALMGMVPDDIYSSLAALLQPPTVPGGGVTNPQSQNTGVVRAQQQIQRPQARGGSMSAAVDQRARERQLAANKANKERVHRENLARQSKKGKK